MSRIEYDPRTMYENLKHIFTSYQERKQGDFEDKEEGCLAITGTYELYRELDGKIYYQLFRLNIVLTKIIPHVYIPDDIEVVKKAGFTHFYKGGRCCLGTEVAILLSWGEKYDTDSFFDRIVDPFLINTISYREEKKAVMGELRHGDAGMEDYYCGLFGVTKQEIRITIFNVHKILLSKKFANGQRCICRKNVFKDCNCSGKQFLMRAIRDQTLREGFYNDMKSISWAKEITFRKR